MKLKTSRLRAFSLIELSIVILIIGIVVSGVIAGSRIVREAKLSSARSQTISSPVTSIKNLMAWYETTMESSFIDAESEDSNTISTWYNSNTQLLPKSDAIQTTPANTPTYIANGINGLPVVRFNGSSSLVFDGSSLAQSNYTIFVVEQRKNDFHNPSTYTHYPFVGCGNLSGPSGGSGKNLNVGYNTNSGNKIVQYNYGTGLSYSVTTQQTYTPRIHTFTFNSQSGKSYWLNGGDAPDASYAAVQTLLSCTPAEIGRTYMDMGYVYTFIGDIGEIIIYTKSVRTEERNAVESYLSKKWGINLSNN